MSTGCKCACCREKSSEEGSLLAYEDVSDPEGIKDGEESEVFAWEAKRLAEYYALSCTNFIVPALAILHYLLVMWPSGFLFCLLSSPDNDLSFPDSS